MLLLLVMYDTPMFFLLWWAGWREGVTQRDEITDLEIWGGHESEDRCQGFGAFLGGDGCFRSLNNDAAFFTNFICAWMGC